MLSALRDIYKAQGVIYDGGLADQIYEPGFAFERLRAYAYNSFIREGSLNSLSTAPAKVAKMSGTTFPETTDGEGADDAMWKAASLMRPVKKLIAGCRADQSSYRFGLTTPAP